MWLKSWGELGKVMTIAQKAPRTHQSHVCPVAGALPVYQSRRVDMLDDLELSSYSFSPLTLLLSPLLWDLSLKAHIDLGILPLTTWWFFSVLNSYIPWDHWRVPPSYLIPSDPDPVSSWKQWILLLLKLFLSFISRLTRTLFPYALGPLISFLRSCFMPSNTRATCVD